ncbi:enoyl-CoA hydratase/isomerase family protein [Mycolicibacterium hippocampi]|uniref:enoyl-CoA hydratase/isomerase family protein n=1 Tax=Mycolicibacterium hippocampi TaxID=659824 RepID=UPI00351271B8
MTTRIATRVVDAVAWVELDGADRLNVIGTQTYTDLAEALRTLESQGSVRAVVIHGAGRAFCAGADIEEIRAFGSRDDFADFIHGFTDALDVRPGSVCPRPNSACSLAEVVRSGCRGSSPSGWPPRC